MMDYSFILGKLFDRVFDIYFPTSNYNTNKVEYKRLENEELEIRLWHERQLVTIFKISEKLEREHIERLILYKLIYETQNFSNDLNFSEEQRNINNKRCQQFIDLLKEISNNSYIGNNYIINEPKLEIENISKPVKVICNKCKGKGKILPYDFGNLLLEIGTLGTRRFLNVFYDKCEKCDGTGYVSEP